MPPGIEFRNVCMYICIIFNNINHSQEVYICIDIMCSVCFAFKVHHFHCSYSVICN